MEPLAFLAEEDEADAGSRVDGPAAGGGELNVQWVLLTGFAEGIPTLAEVRGAVRLDWLNDQRQQHETAVYQQLRDRYKITITPTALEPPRVQSALSLEAD
jgi:hypothetical protein